MCMTFFYLFFFFFSSRRRHTRFDCDWSSDVCSSDLETPALSAAVDVWLEPGGTELLEPGTGALDGSGALADGAGPLAAGCGGAAFFLYRAAVRTGPPLGAPARGGRGAIYGRSEEHTSELQSQSNLVCRLL